MPETDKTTLVVSLYDAWNVKGRSTLGSLQVILRVLERKPCLSTASVIWQYKIRLYYTNVVIVYMQVIFVENIHFIYLKNGNIRCSGRGSANVTCHNLPPPNIKNVIF